MANIGQYFAQCQHDSSLLYAVSFSQSPLNYKFIHLFMQCVFIYVYTPWTVLSAQNKMISNLDQVPVLVVLITPIRDYKTGHTGKDVYGLPFSVFTTKIWINGQRLNIRKLHIICENLGNTGLTFIPTQQWLAGAGCCLLSLHKFSNLPQPPPLLVSYKHWVWMLVPT